MTPQTADFRTKYKTLCRCRRHSLSGTLVLYFIFPAAHVGLSCNCSRKKPRGLPLARAEFFAQKTDWNPIIFHYYCFGAGIPFRGLRLDIYWACALRSGIEAHATAAPSPDLSLKLPHKKQYCALWL